MGIHPNDEGSNVAMVSPLMSPPPVQSANDYGIETICFAPKLVKSLMHRKVIRISSGGVHNICIVESNPSCILRDVYMAFMNGKFTDVVFQGFYTTAQPKTESDLGDDKSTAEKPQTNNISGASSDEEMKEDIDLEASTGLDVNSS